MKNQFHQALLGSVAALTLALVANGAQAQAQAPGWFGSLQGWYVLDTAGDRINSFPSGISARPDDGWGGKAYLGYRFSAPWDIAVGGQGAWLSKGKKADGTRGISIDGDTWNADGEIGYNFAMAPNAGARVFLGVRYAEFDHSRHFVLFGTSSSRTEIDWSGVGPRGGFDFAVRFAPDSNLSVQGSAALAYLFGDYKSRYTASAGPSPINAKKNSDSLNGEAQLALAYEIAPMVNLSAGYRVEYWSDVAHKWGNLQNPPGPTVAGPGPNADRWMHGPFVRVAYNIGAPRGVPVAVVTPPPAASMAKTYIVFFDWDRSTLTPDALKTIADAAAASKTGGVQRVNVTGHADRSGSDQYNMALSLRRAGAVKDQLVRNGVPANQIVVVGRGESQPLVPTADGVREPQNRRVEIVLN